VDLRRARPTIPRVSVTAGLAAVSPVAAVPVGGRRHSRRGKAHDAESAVCRQLVAAREFDRLPGGWDIAGSASRHRDAGPRENRFLLGNATMSRRARKDAFVGFLSRRPSIDWSPRAGNQTRT
jgi:hypothetical protein